LVRSIYICAAIFCLQARASASPVADRPNIVIIYADDMGFGDLSCNNKDSKINTPHLDGLAQSGMNFTNASSSSGICSPSRFAILTGQYHWRRFYDIVKAWEPSVFKENDYTLPKMLKSNGYDTACIGKWHLGWDWSAVIKEGVKPAITKGGEKVYKVEDFDWTKPIPQGPLFAGFDYYFGDDAPNFPPYTWIENDRVLEVPLCEFKITDKIEEGSSECREGPMAKDWKLSAVMPKMQEKTLEWIKARNPNTPFFLYLTLTAPHTPIVPSDEFKGKSGAGPYGDFVLQCDAFVGALVKALKESGAYDNTIVIFSSDNGAASYAFAREMKYEHWSNAPFRGVKADIWEGGHRVPFIVNWPKHVRGGVTSAQMINQTDIFATLAQIIGQALPQNSAADSISFLSLLKGKNAPVRSVMVLNVDEGLYGVRVGSWVYLDHKKSAQKRKWNEPADFKKRMGYAADDENLPARLYDLSTDLGEYKNLYAERPDKVAELSKILKEQLALTQTRP